MIGGKLTLRLVGICPLVVARSLIAGSSQVVRKRANKELDSLSKLDLSTEEVVVVEVEVARQKEEGWSCGRLPRSRRLGCCCLPRNQRLLIPGDSQLRKLALRLWVRVCARFGCFT